MFSQFASDFFKVHYLAPTQHVIRQHSDIFDRIKSMKGFKMKAGGRQFEWPYELSRLNNVGFRGEDEYLPGESSDTNDDIDGLSGETAVENERRIYASAAFDGFITKDSHNKYMFKKGHSYAKQLQYLAEDTARMFQWAFLSDGTGMVGTVDTGVGAMSYDAGDDETTVYLKHARQADTRGILGTQRIQKNMKLVHINAADWATSASASKAQIVGNTVLKVNGVSDDMDVSTTPYVLLKGDQTAVLANGDVLVHYKSRTQDGAGAGAGATLRSFNGLFNWVDDGTLGANLFGLSRTTHPELKSKVNLSDVERAVSAPLLQALWDELLRKAGNEGRDGMELWSEYSVRSQYMKDTGEAAKRYTQDASAKKIIGGYADVSIAFLENGTPVPWRADRDFPYGHLMGINFNDCEAMWSKEISPLDDDGLTLRMQNGKDVWKTYYRAYGQFIMKEPWKAFRLSGCKGYFGA